MPIYEFECIDCNAVFDRLQKISDPDPDSCPDCGHKHVKRRLTAPAFRLAGSGWYETDFKKDGDKKRNLAGKEEPAKADAAKTDAPSGDAAKADTTEKKSVAKADSKPDAKSSDKKQSTTPAPSASKSRQDD